MAPKLFDAGLGLMLRLGISRPIRNNRGAGSLLLSPTRLHSPSRYRTPLFGTHSRPAGFSAVRLDRLKVLAQRDFRLVLHAQSIRPSARRGR